MTQDQERPVTEKRYAPGDRVIWNDHPGTVTYSQLLRLGEHDEMHSSVTFDEVGVWGKWVPDFELRGLGK